MNPLIRAVARFTTPLLPEDYLTLINPLWATGGIRARVEALIPETATATTLTLRPSRPLAPHRAGQYVRLGVDIDGVRHWRSYSLTSPASSSSPIMSVTVKATQAGLVSRQLGRGTSVGDVIRMEPAAGDFVLPDPPPERLLLIAAGSGVTPIMGMLRTLASAPDQPRVDLIVCASDRADVIFGEELRAQAGASAWFTLHERHTRAAGRLDLRQLGDYVGEWEKLPTWICGPPALLDGAEALWSQRGILDQLHVERFQTKLLLSDGGGGDVRFSRSDVELTLDGNTSVLSAGEAAGILMPNGCRMGICHTCVLPLISGQVRDLRTGRVHGEPGDLVQTCISAPACDLEIGI